MGKGSGTIGKMFKDFREWMKEQGVNIPFKEDDFRLLFLFQAWGDYLSELRAQAYAEAQERGSAAQKVIDDLSATPNEDEETA